MRRNREAGQALITAALAMVVLIGVAGLGVDMGVMRYERRLQQTAADAAALAGADNLGYPANGGVIAAAQSASATDGFADNAGGALSACTATGAAVGTTCVQVSDPASGPTTGPHAGDPKYVEAYVAKVHPTYFMKIMGVTTAVVTARAVATNTTGGVNNGCLYTLGNPQNSIEGVNINGSAILNATTCGILDNGDFNTKGNKLIVNAGTFGVSGGANQSGPGGTVTCSVSGACPEYGTPAASDPYKTLTPPCSPCTGGTVVKATSTTTLNPGTYTAIQLSGNGTVTFNPGIYVINGPTGNGGSISCSGTPALSGTGVMFYFTNGSTFSCQGNDNIQLTAPSPGNCPACPTQYDNILMYQDPADTNTGPAPSGPALGGHTGSNYDGVLYFPSDEITFYGTNNSFDVSVVVGKSLALSGNPTVNLQGSKGLPAGATLTVATLVE